MSVEAKSYRSPVESTFTFPEHLVEEVQYKSVTIRELMPSDEARAIAAAGKDGGVLISELIHASLVSAVRADGSVMKISRADESVDAFMASVGPKGRTLVMAAYNAVNQPREDETVGFLRSVRVSVR